MFLLDTDTASAIIRDKKLLRSSVDLLAESDWGISSITWMELQYGLNLLDSKDQRRKLISEFIHYARVFQFDSIAAECAGKVRADLRKIGKPIGAYDPLIAGHAISLGAILVSGNIKHFSKVKNLHVVNWLK